MIYVYHVDFYAYRLYSAPWLDRTADPTDEFHHVETLPRKGLEEDPLYFLKQKENFTTPFLSFPLVEQRGFLSIGPYRGLLSTIVFTWKSQETFRLPPERLKDFT